MPRICFVTVCMGRLAYLRQTLPRVVAQPDCSCVVVDYSCPDRCGDWVAAHFPQVRVVRVPGQARFSPTKSRNAGWRVADAPWVCMFDAEVLFDPAFAEAVAPRLEAGHYYRVDPHSPPLTGTFLCPRPLLEQVGGYDEVYQGWGDQDLDLLDTLRFARATPGAYPAALVRHLPHDDESRTRHYAVKDRWVSFTLNRIYRYLKFDLMRLTGEYLSAELRDRLYRRVTHMVTTSLRDGTDGELDVGLQPGVSKFDGWQMERRLTYRFRRVVAPSEGDPALMVPAAAGKGPAQVDRPISEFPCPEPTPALG